MDWIGDPGAWMIYQVNLPIKCALYASPKTIVSEQISNSYVLNFDKFKVAVVVQVAQTEWVAEVIMQQRVLSVLKETVNIGVTATALGQMMPASIVSISAYAWGNVYK